MVQFLYNEPASQQQCHLLHSLQNTNHSSDSFGGPTIMSDHQHDSPETSQTVLFLCKENLDHLPTNQDSFIQRIISFQYRIIFNHLLCTAAPMRIIPRVFIGALYNPVICLISMPLSSMMVFKPFSESSLAAHPPLMPEPTTIASNTLSAIISSFIVSKILMSSNVHKFTGSHVISRLIVLINS